MIKSFLTHELTVRGEPALDQYLRDSQTDFTDIAKETFGDLLKDLKDQNLKLKRLCTPLSLQASETKTTAFDGAISNQDYAERLRLVINVTAITGNAVFSLQGSDDNGTTYENVSVVDNDSLSSETITINQAGEYSFSLTNLFEKYRLRLISIGTTITYSSYLIEDTYTILHREITRMRIYGSLMANPNDVWESKYKYYTDSYMGMLANTKFAYDTDNSGDIDEEEGDININQTITFRP